MKNTILIVMLMIVTPSHAVEFFMEQGKTTTWFAATGHYTEATYGSIGFRTEGDQFIEVIQGGWAGESSSQFGGVSFGIKSKGKYFAEAALGGVHLENMKTDQLDGKNQFLITVGIGARIDNLFVTTRIRHFSNAGTMGKNHGFEVFALSLGVSF